MGLLALVRGPYLALGQVPGAALSEKPEPACEGASLRHSRGQLTPLGHCGGTVLFKDVATIEVTILIEVIVDRGVDGSEILQGLEVPEPWPSLLLVVETVGVSFRLGY